jgi:hypothetical protein
MEQTGNLELHVVISFFQEKWHNYVNSFGNNCHIMSPSHDKIYQQTGIEENFLSLIKNTYKNPISKIKHYSEKLFKIRNKAKIFLLTTPIQHKTSEENKQMYRF